MDELVDILNEDGSLSGKRCMKSEAHRYGYLHPTIHVWLYTKKGELLFQKRAASKKTFPNLLDVSVAGHIGAGEDVILSALREVEEEVGLSLKADNLIKIGVRKHLHQHSEQLTDYELHHVFLSELKVPLSNLKLQKEEVADILLKPLDRFKNDLLDTTSSKQYVPNTINYYGWIIQQVKLQLL